MKVLVVSANYPPEVGAAPSRIANMAEGLIQQGMEVDLLTCLPNYPKGRIFDGYRGCFSRREQIRGVNCYRYWTFATVSKNPLLRILNLFAFGLIIWVFALKRRKIRSYDRVIIQTPPIVAAFSAVVIFRLLYRRVTILNVSDLWPSTAVELGAIREGSLVHRVMAWMERFIYRHASAIQGQSQEILDHVREIVPQKSLFLYRNLQHAVLRSPVKPMRQPLKIVYAGLLGVAQDLLSLIQQVDFRKIGAEFHLYGGGNQLKEIETYLSEHPTGVFYHGFLEKEAMVEALSGYHASIVPLKVHIRGAVPSKIFDLLPVGVPLLFCGGGEGAKIVSGYRLGMVSMPGDFVALEQNIRTMIQLSEEQYEAMCQNCLQAAEGDFCFEKQIVRYGQWLNNPA